MRESFAKGGARYALARRCVGPGSEGGSAFAPVIVEEASLRRCADCTYPLCADVLAHRAKPRAGQT
jgi:hypothetical protein